MRAPRLPLRHHITGFWEEREAKAAGQKLDYNGILALGSEVKPWGFKADTKEARQGLRTETETFLLLFFLQYKTTVENNFS